MKTWIILGEQSPLDIRELVKVGRELDLEIGAISRGAKDVQDIFYFKNKLDVIIRHLLDVLPNEKKDDKMIKINFEKAYARILRRLDEREETMQRNLTPEVIPLYISEIQAILEGDIFSPLNKASKFYPKDKEKFRNKVLELVHNHARVFGSEERFKGKKGFPAIFEDSSQSPPMSEKELSSEEGKSLKEKEFNKTFPEYKDVFG